MEIVIDFLLTKKKNKGKKKKLKLIRMKIVNEAVK